MSRRKANAKHRESFRVDKAQKKKNGQPSASYVMHPVDELGKEPSMEALRRYARSFRPGDAVKIDRRRGDPVRHGGAVTVAYCTSGTVVSVHPDGLFVTVHIHAERPYLESFWPEELAKGGKP